MATNTNTTTTAKGNGNRKARKGNGNGGNAYGMRGNRATLCRLCARPSGATMAQITKATGGQTCYNTLSALGRAGHVVTHGKGKGAARVWYLAPASAKGSKRPAFTFAKARKHSAPATVATAATA